MSEQLHFLNQLRSNRLVSEEQLAELPQLLGSKKPLTELTGELVARGWLTPYQVEQLCAGQGKGLVLGQYRILTELGRGGFGCVYRAVHSLMHREVALKVIAPGLLENAQVRRSFRREILAVTHLQHPNIVMAYDADEVDDRLFLVMEYVAGPNLEQLVRQQGPLPIALGCAILAQVGRALQYAHEQGTIHRDIKPANLLLPRAALTGSLEVGSERGRTAFGQDPLVKVVDFGLARLQGPHVSSTYMSQGDRGFVGTPDFVSPEQARNDPALDIRTDLYSLGCTLYFAFTGHRPFKGKSLIDVVAQHLEKEPPPLESYRPEVPVAVASIIRRLMAKDPQQRFRTPAELVAELGFLLSATPAQALAFPPLPHSGPIRPGHSSAATDPELAQLSPTTRLPARGRETNVPPLEALDSVPLLANLQQEMPPVRLVSPPSAPEASATVNISLSNDTPPPVGIEELVNHVPSLAVTVGEFRAHWEQWLVLLESLLEQRGLAVTEASYRGLHTALVAEARALLTQAAEPERPQWQQLVDLVEPWVRLSALTATDPETLASLMQASRALQQQFGWGQQGWNLGLTVLLVLGVVVVATLSTWLLPQLRNWDWRTLPRSWSDVPPPLLLAGLVVVLVVGMLTMFLRRSR